MLSPHPGTRSHKHYPVAQKILRYRIQLEDFDDLLAGPLSGRVLYDIEVHINAAMHQTRYKTIFLHYF